jgi:hypothetical protein
MQQVNLTLQCENCKKEKITTHIDFTNWVELDCVLKKNPDDKQNFNIVLCDECAAQMGLDVPKKTVKEDIIIFLAAIKGKFFKERS